MMFGFIAKQGLRGHLPLPLALTLAWCRFIGHPKNHFLCLSYRQIVDDGSPRKDVLGVVGISAFQAQIEYLNRYCNLLPLDEILHRYELHARLYAWPVTLTFDGGWKEYHRFLRPVATQKLIPMLVFVPLTSVDSGKRPWYERLQERLAENSLGLPFVWQGETWETGDPVESQELFSTILQTVFSFTGSERDSLIAELEDKLWGSDQAEERELLSWSELKDIVEDGVKIGIQLPPPEVLRYMPLDEQQEMLLQSMDLQRQLDERLKPIVGFEPYLGDYYSDRVINHLKVAGVACAVSHVPGRNAPHTNRHHFYRIPINSGDFPHFVKKLYSAFLWPGEYASFRYSYFSVID